MEELIKYRQKVQIKEKNLSDIYSGEEQIAFIKRHPIYRTLMKLEFENVLRSYKK